MVKRTFALQLDRIMRIIENVVKGTTVKVAFPQSSLFIYSLFCRFLFLFFYKILPFDLFCAHFFIDQIVTAKSTILMYLGHLQ